MADKPHRGDDTTAEPRMDPEGLVHAQKLAEIGLMTAAVLHELKQPLAGIKGYAQLLKEFQAENALALEKATQILAQVDRIEQLIASHRRFLHVGSQAKTRVDLKATAQEALRLLEPLARHAGVETVLKSNGILEVEAAEGQLQQILINLVANAVDASSTSDKKRLVEVVVRTEGGCPEVLVADQGAGIPAANVSRLFTPFFTTKGPDKGTGLGLFISRRLAESNGAALQLVTAAEVGSQASTVFRLRFAASSAPAAAAQRRSVLVVDDEEIVCSLLTSLLQPDGTEVCCAASGDEAIQMLEKRSFDLVISDKNLPGAASGLDVARTVRKRSPGCPFILMTGYASVETAQEGLSLGILDYIEKPFDDMAELRRRIREALKPQAAARSEGPSRRVLVVEDRPADAVKIGEAVGLAGGVPIVVTLIKDALAQAAESPPAGVILSLDLKDRILPEDIRKLCKSCGGGLVTVCDHPSLDQTVSAIRMGAVACLPRALASPQALSKELARVMALPKAAATGS